MQFRTPSLLWSILVPLLASTAGAQEGGGAFSGGFVGSANPEEVVRAIDAGDKDTLARLLRDKSVLEAGLPQERLTPLLYAIVRGRPSAVEAILDAGADPNQRVDDIGGRGPIALHLAAERGDAASVKLLIAKRANVRARDPKRRTPLHLACDAGSPAVARLLLDAGAPVKWKAEDGLTPLHYAVGAPTGGKELAELLLARGAYVNEEDGQGRTALHLAAAAGDADVTKALLAAKPDLTSANTEEAHTPLHSAVTSGELEVVQLLIAARPEMLADENLTASLIQAAKQRHHREVQDVIRAEADRRARAPKAPPAAATRPAG